jgi:hypothetical protein
MAFSAQGKLHKTGTASGSSSQVDLIPEFQIPTGPDPSVGSEAIITSFLATAEDGTANTVVKLQVSLSSGSGFSTVAQIVIPDGGTVLLTFRGSDKDDEGIKVKKGKYVRVQYIQTTTGNVSATLMGVTAATDIVDTVLA